MDAPKKCFFLKAALELVARKDRALVSNLESHNGTFPKLLSKAPLELASLHLGELMELLVHLLRLVRVRVQSDLPYTETSRKAAYSGR